MTKILCKLKFCKIRFILFSQRKKKKQDKEAGTNLFYFPSQKI